MQGLDGLRAIAVACVLVAHASDSPDNPTLLYRIALELRLGALGVKLFFVISGFIITWLLLREERRHGDISLRFFWLRRSVRIIPPLAGYLAVVFLLSFFFQHIAPNPRDYLAAITFSWGWWADVENWWVGHTWSLSIEEQFYALWPLAFTLLIRKSATRMMLVLLALGVASAAWRCWLAMDGASLARMYNGTDVRLDGLCLGAALAFYRRGHLQDLGEGARTLLTHATPVVALVLFIWEIGRAHV